jgi:hypothetical protein
MYERVYYRPRYARSSRRIFSRAITDVSGISREFSGRLVTKTLESFNVGLSLIERHLELSVPDTARQRPGYQEAYQNAVEIYGTMEIIEGHSSKGVSSCQVWPL